MITPLLKDEIIQDLSRLIGSVAAEEAYEIVRCYDCQLFDTHDKRCKYFNHGVDGLDFCSNGKKKFTNYLN